jgi:hypothetical protein
MKTSKLNRDNVSRNLPNSSRQDLLWLLKATRKELRRRGSRKVELLNGWQSFANFMAGAAWAMACRAELRAAHDHPRIGKRPASGEMWLPAELVKTVRLSVKERGFSALTAPTASQLRAQWAGYLNQAGKDLHVDAGGASAGFEGLMARAAGDSITPSRAVVFRPRMAEYTVRRILGGE